METQPVKPVKRVKKLLTDTAIKTAKAKDKDYKLFDSGGLFLLVKTTGGKYWRLKFYLNSKERVMSLGIYPLITLADARIKRDDAKRLVLQGIDPVEVRNEQKEQAAIRAKTTFELVATEWLGNQKQLALATIDKNKWLLNFAFDVFGNKPIDKITPPDVLAVCRTLEARGTIDSAHRLKVICGQVFRYAIATSRATFDPTRDLKGVLQPIITKHYAAITDPKEAARLMQDIYIYQGHYTVVYALKLAPLFFVRAGELRAAKWADIDLDAKEWRYTVPKTKTEHIVPLSSQAVTLLTELKAISGNSVYVFPSVRTPKNPISENTLNAALRRLGYTSEQMCVHGFRAMARTILDEVLDYPIEVIEMQLAHAVRDTNGRAYNRTKYIKQRHDMMQHWSDYLDELQANNVVAVKLGGGAA